MSGNDDKINETVADIVELYASERVELQQLFGDIKREFGSVKTCELETYSNQREE